MPLTPNEAEDLARDAMDYLAHIVKDKGAWSSDLERLLIDGAFRRWTNAQRNEAADFYAPNTERFVKGASIGYPMHNMARLYIAWLLRNTHTESTNTEEQCQNDIMTRSPDNG